MTPEQPETVERVIADVNSTVRKVLCDSGNERSSLARPFMAVHSTSCLAEILDCQAKTAIPTSEPAGRPRTLCEVYFGPILHPTCVREFPFGLEVRFGPEMLCTFCAFTYFPM